MTLTSVGGQFESAAGLVDTSTSIGTAKSSFVGLSGTGERGSPWQLVVSTLTQRILRHNASRNRERAPLTLKADTLMSGNSATSA